MNKQNDVHVTKIHMQVVCFHHITTCNERVRKSYRQCSTKRIPVPQTDTDTILHKSTKEVVEQHTFTGGRERQYSSRALPHGSCSRTPSGFKQQPWILTSLFTVTYCAQKGIRFSNCVPLANLRQLRIHVSSKRNNAFHDVTLSDVAPFVGTGRSNIRYSNGHTKRKYRHLKKVRDYY